MRNYHRPELIDAAGLKIGVNGLGYNIGFGETDDGQLRRRNRLRPVRRRGPLPRAMLDEVGFFDPDFFAYYEDFDLAWRGRLAGWVCVAAPRAVVYHLHSATSGEWSPFKVYQTHRNKWYVIVKNWPAGQLIRYLPALFFADAASFCLALLRGRGMSALRARLDLLRSLGSLLRKRGEVQGKRKLSDRQVAALFSPHEHLFRTFLRKMGV